MYSKAMCQAADTIISTRDGSSKHTDSSPAPAAGDHHGNEVANGGDKLALLRQLSTGMISSFYSVVRCLNAGNGRGGVFAQTHTNSSTCIMYIK